MIFFMGCFLLLGGCTSGGAPQQAAVNQTESPNTSGGETTESSLEILRNYPDYAEAYADKIEELEKESREPGDIEYDLIYLDEDHIPELVAGQTGYYVNVYTYDAGMLCTVMEEWGYGAGGNHGRRIRF